MSDDRSTMTCEFSDAAATAVAEAPRLGTPDGAPTPARHPSELRSSRRAWFSGAVRNTALMTAAGGLAASLLAPRRAEGAPSTPADVDPGALMHRLVNRLTFGYSNAELAAANALGYSGYLEQQLDYQNITEDPALVARIAAMASMNAQPYQLYDTTVVSSNGLIVTELIEATILRAVLSKRQLLERMVEFWSDHFSVDVNLESETYLKTLDDRAIRQNALVSFPALLNANARSPAMLFFLNNDQSSNGSINENYARELIELHTVGAEYFYSFPQTQTQATIIAVARCLTGWGWRTGNYNDTTPGGTGVTLRATFFYNGGTVRNGERIGATTIGNVSAGLHDTASKTLGTVFGATVIPARTSAAGQQDGIDVLNMLAAHPQTALYISTKMCKRFLGEGVPQSIINSVRDAYLNASNPQGLGDIKAMLRVMLAPNNVAAAYPRLKRPFHLFVSALRATGATVTSTNSMRTYLTRAGHLPFNWTSPDGFPDTTAYWAGQVLPRWNFCAALVSNTSGSVNGISGLTINDTALFTGATTQTQVLDKISQTLTGGFLSSSERSSLLVLFSATPSATQKRDALGTSMCLPTFQWY